MLYVRFMVLQLHKSQFHVILKQIGFYRTYTYAYIVHTALIHYELVRIVTKQLLIICISMRILIQNLSIWSHIYLNLLFLVKMQKSGDLPFYNTENIYTNLHMLKNILSFLSHTRYIFELSRRTPLPEVFLSKILEPTLKSLAECCESEDSAACINTQVLYALFSSATLVQVELENCSSWAKSDPISVFT